MYLLNLRVECIEIQKKIYSRIGERGHASIMTGVRIDMVDPDSVGAQLLHQGGIALTLAVVDEGIVWDELVGDALEDLLV